MIQDVSKYMIEVRGAETNQWRSSIPLAATEVSGAKSEAHNAIQNWDSCYMVDNWRFQYQICSIGHDGSRSVIGTVDRFTGQFTDIKRKKGERR
jgi:hypothetical protein